MSKLDLSKLDPKGGFSPAELRMRVQSILREHEVGGMHLTRDLGDLCSAVMRAGAEWAESALRPRVEALEGVLQKIADAPCEREQGCIAHRIARAALQPDKGEEEALRKVVEEHGAPTPAERPRPVNPMKRLSRQPDKGERCGGGGWTLEQVRYSDGSYGRTESYECPGCPDCREESDK